MPYKDPEKRKLAQRKYAKKHYEANKPACISRTRVQRHSATAEWNEFKSRLRCVKCGFSHPAALDFHHVKRSPDNVHLHKLIRNKSFARALEEIKKCIVLCANCHRIHHSDEHKNKKNPSEEG